MITLTGATESQKFSFVGNIFNRLFEFMVNIMLLLIVAFQIYSCPYTKVEESFNTQAMHDWIYHQSNLSAYDHLEFPGVVPRTFIGSIFVATVAYPYIHLIELLGYGNKLFALIFTRTTLGICGVVSFLRFKESVKFLFGRNCSIWLTLITATQFHYLFYLSRPLPNTFALILVQEAIRQYLVGNNNLFMWIGTFVAVIFRFELVIFFGFVALFGLFSKQISFRLIFFNGLVAFAISLASTVLFDSFFWSRWLWPEGEVLWYNTILNKSSNWGVMPFHWYFTSALPRSLLSALFFIVFAPKIISQRLSVIFYASLAYIATYSLLPHKELRFIIYTIPIFNLSAALVCSFWAKSLNVKGISRTLQLIILNNSLVLNTMASCLFLYVSSFNYPGGVALEKLHYLACSQSNNSTDCDTPMNVHIDVFSAQTGISRFGHLHSNWDYNKTENLMPGDKISFDYLLLHLDAPENIEIYRPTHKVIEIVYGYSHILFEWEILNRTLYRIIENPANLLHLGNIDLFPLKIFQKPLIAILERVPDVEVSVVDIPRSTSRMI